MRVASPTSECEYNTSNKGEDCPENQTDKSKVVRVNISSPNTATERQFINKLEPSKCISSPSPHVSKGIGEH